MTYNSKKNIVSMAAGILFIAVYILYARMGSAPAAEDLAGWAKLMLVFIGIGAGAQIAIQILFHIGFAVGIAAKERMQGRKPEENVERLVKSSMVEDERDKLIEHKSNRVGHYFSGLGLVAALFALAFGAAALTALHILLGCAFFGNIVGGGVSVYFHESGV